MAAIDVGGAAINRGNSFGPSLTLIDRTNPANDSGKITTFEIWAASNLADTKVGTFSGSGTSWNDRDYATIGSVTAGSKQTFSGLDVDVETDDIVGTYFSTGKIEYETSGGSGICWKGGDFFNSGVQSYTVVFTVAIISLYGIGTTEVSSSSSSSSSSLSSSSSSSKSSSCSSSSESSSSCSSSCSSSSFSSSSKSSSCSSSKSSSSSSASVASSSSSSSSVSVVAVRLDVDCRIKTSLNIDNSIETELNIDCPLEES